jgi:hypothetical protein
MSRIEMFSVTYNVPAIVSMWERMSTPVRFSTVAIPKSVILGDISESKRMLLGFTSKWTTFFLCR